MLDALKEESIVNKVGGRFKLTALIQKRMLELMDGARPLVDRGNMTDLEVVIQEILQDKMQVVLQEIAQDKIFLDSTQKVRVAGDFQGTGESMELDLGDL